MARKRKKKPVFEEGHPVFSCGECRNLVHYSDITAMTTYELFVWGVYQWCTSCQREKDVAQ